VCDHLAAGRGIFCLGGFRQAQPRTVPLNVGPEIEPHPLTVNLREELDRSRGLADCIMAPRGPEYCVEGFLPNAGGSAIPGLIAAISGLGVVSTFLRNAAQILERLILASRHL